MRGIVVNLKSMIFCNKYHFYNMLGSSLISKIDCLKDGYISLPLSKKTFET